VDSENSKSYIFAENTAENFKKLKSLKIHANKNIGENVSIMLEACIRKS
jgi:hypothetical protein